MAKVYGWRGSNEKGGAGDISAVTFVGNKKGTQKKPVKTDLTSACRREAMRLYVMCDLTRLIPIASQRM